MIEKDVRYRAVVHYQHFLRSIRKVAKLYGVSRSSLQRWLAAKPSMKPCKRRKTIRTEIVDCIHATMRANPCSDMQQLCDAIKQSCCGVVPSTAQTVGRWVRRLGYSRKKVYTVVDHTPSTKVVDDFCDAYTPLRDEEIICIDEAGFYVGAHGRYGYAQRGSRIHVSASRTLRRSRFTLVMAVGCDGIVHYELLDGSCRKADFIRFVSNLPRDLVTGKTLVMDNLRCHHSTETLAAIDALGCHPLFIPPYSPRFNAIEYSFSAIKRRYRRECSEVRTPAVARDADDYACVLVAVLAAYGDCRALFRRVRRTVLHYCASGEVLRYD
jgi:transposase